jgi:uncharacterized protein
MGKCMQTGLNRRQSLLAASAAALCASLPARAACGPWPLWTIKQGKGLVYLMGETPRRRADWHDARIEALVPKCGAVWTETNKILRAPVADLMKQYGLGSKPIDALLSDKDRARLSQAEKVTGTPHDQIAAFHPWLVAQTMEDAFYSSAGFKGLAAENVLVAEAAKASVPVSSEFAIQDNVVEWFGTMTAEQDIEYLRYTLDEILLGAEENERTFADWSCGDDARATAWIVQMRQRYPALYPKIVVERNKGWVPRIQKMLTAEKPSLVITGLYHLVGPDSVHAQLRANGLVTTRM